MNPSGEYFQNLSRTRGLFFAIPAANWNDSLFARTDAWLTARADELVRDVPLDEQWTFFETRMTGRRPFNTWADLPTWNAAPPKDASPDEALIFKRRQQILYTVQIMRGEPSPHLELPSWPYRWHRLGDFALALDILNPGNELHLPIATISDDMIVLQLVIDSASYDDTAGARHLLTARLPEQVWLFDLAAAFAELIGATHVWGSAFPERSAVDAAYFRGQIPPTARYWDYLFTLTVVEDARITAPGRKVLAADCPLVRPFLPGRSLLVTFEGFTAAIRANQNERIAKACSMTSAWGLYR